MPRFVTEQFPNGIACEIKEKKYSENEHLVNSRQEPCLLKKILTSDIVSRQCLYFIGYTRIICSGVNIISCFVSWIKFRKKNIDPIQSECSLPWMIKSYHLNLSVLMCLTSLNFKRVLVCVFVTCLQNNRVKCT